MYEEPNTDDGQGSYRIAPLVRVPKGVAIQQNTGVSVSIKMSSAGLAYITPHPYPMRYQIFILTSGIVIALPHMPEPIYVANISEKQTLLPKVKLVGVRTDVPDLIVDMDKSKSCTSRC